MIRSITWSFAVRSTEYWPFFAFSITDNSSDCAVGRLLRSVCVRTQSSSTRQAKLCRLRRSKVLWTARSILGSLDSASSGDSGLMRSGNTRQGSLRTARLAQGNEWRRSFDAAGISLVAASLGVDWIGSSGKAWPAMLSHGGVVRGMAVQARLDRAGLIWGRHATAVLVSHDEERIATRDKERHKCGDDMLGQATRHKARLRQSWQCWA